MPTSFNDPNPKSSQDVFNHITKHLNQKIMFRSDKGQIALLNAINKIEKGLKKPLPKYDAVTWEGFSLFGKKQTKYSATALYALAHKIYELHKADDREIVRMLYSIIAHDYDDALLEQFTTRVEMLVDAPKTEQTASVSQVSVETAEEKEYREVQAKIAEYQTKYNSSPSNFEAARKNLYTKDDQYRTDNENTNIEKYTKTMQVVLMEKGLDPASDIQDKLKHEKGRLKVLESVQKAIDTESKPPPNLLKKQVAQLKEHNLQTVKENLKQFQSRDIGFITRKKDKVDTVLNDIEKAQKNTPPAPQQPVQAQSQQAQQLQSLRAMQGSLNASGSNMQEFIPIDNSIRRPRSSGNADVAQLVAKDSISPEPKEQNFDFDQPVSRSRTVAPKKGELTIKYKNKKPEANTTTTIDPTNKAEAFAKKFDIEITAPKETSISTGDPKVDPNRLQPPPQAKNPTHKL